MTFDPRNVNARLSNLEAIVLGFHRPVYVNGEQPSETNTHPAIVQEPTGLKNADGSPAMKDVLEYVPGLVNNVETLISYQKGTLPAGEGSATGAAAFIDAPKKSKKKATAV